MLPTLLYLSACALLSAGCAMTSAEARAAPTTLSLVIAVGCTSIGQIALANLALALTVAGVRICQYLIFGQLRIAEWQRVWERFVHYAMGQLVILGAIVEPDWAELMLWTSFALLNGVLGLYSGLCRDRLEYMNHLPNPPSSWAYARVILLEVAIIAIAATMLVVGVSLLLEAGASTLWLFFFQAVVVLLDGLYTLVQAYLHRRERRTEVGPSSDVLYYATLVPELSMQLSRLCHYLHVWYVHGLSFSIMDVLLLANTKAAFEALQQRLITHFNFLRADANLQRRFRSASREELSQLNDCCAICREPMDGAKVLPCGHFFHYQCLRSWLEQSHSCPICRASLATPPPASPRARGPLARQSGSGPGRGAEAAGGLPSPADASGGEAAGSSASDGAGEPLRLGGVSERLRRESAASEGEGGTADAELLAEDEGDGEEDDDEGEGEEQTYLLFSSENWPWLSWLPRLHLEVIRRPSRDSSTRENQQPTNTTEEELRQLREMFPHQTEGALRRALLRSPSLEGAIEMLLVET